MTNAMTESALATGVTAATGTTDRCELAAGKTSVCRQLNTNHRSSIKAVWQWLTTVEAS